MKVAFVHYWLVSMRGGEKVLEQLCTLFPDADIFTHVVESAALSPTLRRHQIRTTFIQKLPWATRSYQKYLALMPLALEQLDLRDYDLVISSESGPAKGVIVGPDALHLCYCHSPMRYIWNMYHDYHAELGGLGRLAFAPLAHYLRLCDAAAAVRVDRFVANSANVARRIHRYYGRPAKVVCPPVDVEAFEPSADHEGFYLVAGQLVGYKRVDLAIDACTRTGRRLVVIGAGEHLGRLERRAGSTVMVLGGQPFDVLRDHYRRCRALIFPGEEDFGIVPVEAMASGKPVVAYARGGSLETVVEGRTGLFFHNQTVEAVIDALERFEQRETEFSSATISEHARRFSQDAFRAGMAKTIDEMLQEAGRHRASTAAFMS